MIIQNGGLSYGADPELFLEKGGMIVGSERTIPRKGLFPGGVEEMNLPHVVRDGVQVELHPQYGLTSKQAVGKMAGVFKTLKDHLDKEPDFKACFKQVVDVGKLEMEALSKKASELGCQESENVYGLKRVQVDGSVYLKRSAGGHVHIGLTRPIFHAGRHVPRGQRVDKRARLVPICDYILGNTCVLLDRDPNQVERRKLYGRAGEYRKPKYGLEYRTLSNFWIRCPELTQLVFGLAEMCVGILGTTLNGGEDLERELLTAIPSVEVVKAIQRNDLDLASRNWAIVREFIRKHALPTHVIHDGNLAQFDRFVSIVAEKGLDFFFPEDPIVRWTSGAPDGMEWDRFVRSIQLPKVII